MKLDEAFRILDIPSNSTPEEIKKQYRQLTKKLHPDVNKEPDAEEKFKKINEAYQVASSGKSSDKEDQLWENHTYQSPFGGMPFNPFEAIFNRQKQKTYQADNIKLFITISFAESVLGCAKDMKIQRQNKCKDCQGQGQITVNNGCSKCHGQGQITDNQGNMIFIRPCDQCHGIISKTNCKTCQGNGTLEVESSVHISIPGGVSTGNVLRLSGMGNYVGSFGGLMDQFTDAHLHITVTPELGLYIEGNDVMSHLTISLLDALKGCQRQIKTIKGNKDVIIPPLSKNKEEIALPKLGVNGKGKQRIILRVDYPDDITTLLNVLDHNQQN